MNLIEILFLPVGGMIVVGLAMYGISSIWERERRAAVISLVLMLIAAGVWYSLTVWLPTPDWVRVSVMVLMVAAVILWFIPTGPITVLDGTGVNERVDERDTMFAREEYLPDSEKYRQYYSTHPEEKKIDDRWRQLPAILQPGGRFYNPDTARRVKSVFADIRSMTSQVDGEVRQETHEVDPDRITPEIKEFVLRLGADEVGVARLNPMHLYSHVGRGPEPWGAPIDNRHRFAIVFSLEMAYQIVRKAPEMPIVEESARQYLLAAQISVRLAAYIRNFGYPARAHISDSNYQIILPAVAQDAGLGELGRLGYLISPRFGARIRLGAVTTDLPLVPDRPIAFGVQDFCRRCQKCAVNCPPRAIPEGSTTVVRGVRKWQLDVERCFHYWRVVGTDCGLCMKVCPFSHPPTIMHNLVRAGIKRSSLARTVSVWGDDLLYGRQISREHIVS
ncbi:MAG: reductive dehalogenase domain-containing protein [bacterium]